MLKRPPTHLELFEKTHRTKKPKEGTSNTEYITPKVGIVVDAYKDCLLTKYGDDSDSYPSYDHDLWLDVTGGIKKGRVLGFGSLSDPQRFMLPSLTAPSTTSDNFEVMVERMRDDMKKELLAEREQMRKELLAEHEEEMRAQKEEMLAQKKEMCAHKEEVAKILNEMKKLTKKK